MSLDNFPRNPCHKSKHGVHWTEETQQTYQWGHASLNPKENSKFSKAVAADLKEKKRIKGSEKSSFPLPPTGCAWLLKNPQSQGQDRRTTLNTYQKRPPLPLMLSWHKPISLSTAILILLPALKQITVVDTQCIYGVRYHTHMNRPSNTGTRELST